MTLQLILGNQLFPLSYYPDKKTPIFMCEDHDLCTHYRYHKHKIIFFLASMRNYRDQLIAKEYSVDYHVLAKSTYFFKKLKQYCQTHDVKTLRVYEVEDKFFEERIKYFAQENHLQLEVNNSPMFLVTRSEFQKYNELTRKPFMKNFYEGLRKSTGILMDKNKNPVGGKFSFDTENRKKIPKKFEVIQNAIEKKQDRVIDEVKALVDKYFPNHPGKSEDFWMATTRAEALKGFEDFLKNRLIHFGEFEDALDERDPFLYHSVISPYINIGFLTPEEVIKKVLKTSAPLNSSEGFIRQVMGWREFVRGIYQVYSDQQENSNFFNHHKKLTSHWYEGNTGLPPLDDAIKKVLKFGYNHHIERLMVLSNLMLLCEISPQEVHRWFMEMYVDSSDWVMGPNVYGMGQFSDGGIFATKPYISGSNYIMKMGHYKKGPWCDIWDGLYWQFIEKHQDFFKKNYRMSMMVKLLEKMPEDKKKGLYQAANKFKLKVTC